MSAFPDDADHFLRWLHEHKTGEHDGDSFVGPADRGTYLHRTVG